MISQTITQIIEIIVKIIIKIGQTANTISAKTIPAFPDLILATASIIAGLWIAKKITKLVIATAIISTLIYLILKISGGVPI